MITLRNYQIPAATALSTCRRGVIKSPAGSGKTIIAAAALNKWSRIRSKIAGRKMQVCWVANSHEQLQQAHKAIAAFPDLLSQIDFNAVCYQAGLSLVGYDLAIFDECHHIPAETFRKITKYYEGWRWGLSATPERADDLAAVVFTLIGPLIYEVPREALVEAGQLATAHVYLHRPNLPGEMEAEVTRLGNERFEEQWKRYGRYAQCSAEELKKRAIWQFAQKLGIIKNEKRNRQIIDLALRHKDDSTLILVPTIELGQQLAESIPDSALVFSKMGLKKRRETLAAFTAGSIKTCLATSLADEGLDVPRAAVLILASGGRSDIKTEQRTGRVLRSFEGKANGTIHDFWDVQHSFLLAQSKRRAALYKQLGYQIFNPEQKNLWASETV
jgi:superfamily II DNA or RNA helicase